MNQNQIHTIIQKLVKNINLHSLMKEIVLKEGFCQKTTLTYEPLQQFITLLLLYFCLRYKKSELSKECQTKIGQLQLKITEELNSYNFNFKINQKQKIFDRYFTERILILSLLLSHLMTALSRKLSIESVNLEDYFITLLYLSTGKLVSLKCFQFCKTKMKQRNTKKVLSTYSTVKHFRREESSKVKTNFYKSQVQQFKQELKTILHPQNHHHKSVSGSQEYYFTKKLSKKLNANPQKSKKKFTQIHENVDVQPKQRSKTLIGNMFRIRHKSSVDLIIQKQNKSKKGESNSGVRFMLKHQSFGSRHSTKNSIGIQHSRPPLKLY